MSGLLTPRSPGSKVKAGAGAYRVRLFRGEKRMSLKSFSFTGTLYLSPLGTLVAVEDGGYWIIKIGWFTARRLKNKRVYVEGTMSGLDDIFITTIRLVDEPERRGFWDWLIGW